MFTLHRSVDWFATYTGGLSAESVWRWWRNHKPATEADAAKAFAQI